MVPLIISENLPVIFLQILFLNFVVTTALQPTYVFQQCVNSISGNYTQNSLYQKNLNNLLADLTTQAPTTGFYNTTSGESPDEVYGLFYCRGDVDRQLCHDCVLSAAQTITKVCTNQKEALVFYRECTLRFANRNIFSQDEEVPWVFHRAFDKTSNPVQFQEVLSSTVESLIKKAAYNSSYNGFATGEAVLSPIMKLYCLVQCTPDILGLPCDRCLHIALTDTQDPCCSGGRVRLYILSPSCQMMYDTIPFYSPPSPPPAPPPPQSPPGLQPAISAGHKGIVYYLIRAAIPAVGCLVLLLCAIVFHVHRRRKKSPRLVVEDPKSHDSLQFNLQTIQSATSNFSIANKLGQGGFGAVYRGRLTDGREVAVKRLSKDSGQGIREFSNEVQLLAELQHRNLVSLLGFCLEGEEKLLIYEFLPNLSLDRFLFDPNNRKYVDWETRFKIIMGIARGLLYLHEDSRLKIIHRDLKSSNILLDQEMNPKIADFGMARLVRFDQTQANTTKIVGTYGYMAPEYAMSGVISIKSDVYSFGVLLLEIISGRSNNFFNQSLGTDSLLSRAWRLWNTGAILDLVDPSLGHNYSRAEVLRCIQVALFCVQEDAASRPTMASVMLMLNSNSSDFPPLQGPSSLPSSTINRMDDNKQGGQRFEHQGNEPGYDPNSVNGLDTTDLYPR